MAMTPLQSVLWDVKQRIENDKKLSKLRQKVNSGKATYADTASYSTHVGNLLGDTFAQHILSVSPELREALTVELLHDRYMDINAIIDRVQKSMDEAQGLHLAPQHSPFYDDRAHQIGSALADPTVPDETIKRRARAATATATKSMHDDRMKSEAKFRSRAGLKCTVNRIAAAKCCEWCDQVAGKYAYEDTPPDLWRRHDNCNCTIVYGTRRDRQVLRGTEKKWEIVAEGAGAPEPVRLTPEQARKLQEKKRRKVLTKGGKPAIIKLPDIEIGRSVGAKAKNYDIVDPQTGEIFHLVEGSRITNAQVFAGKGTHSPLHEGVAEGLTEQYGGSVNEWRHAKGHGILDYYGDEIGAEIHWFEEPTVGRVKFKVKRWDE